MKAARRTSISSFNMHEYQSALPMKSPPSRDPLLRRSGFAQPMVASSGPSDNLRLGLFLARSCPSISNSFRPGSALARLCPSFSNSLRPGLALARLCSSFSCSLRPGLSLAKLCPSSLSNSLRPGNGLASSK